MDRVLRIFILLFFAGCVSIDGGAVEVSWVVRTPDGRGINNCSCACPAIAKMRLVLVPVEGGPDACAGQKSCEFSCGQHSGVTTFSIPPGTYAMSLVPVGATGDPLDGTGSGFCTAKSAVAPAVREVQKGRLVQLDAVLIQAGCAETCGGEDNTKVCK